MKDYPTNFNTKEDFYNCLAMVQAGELPANGLRRELDALEHCRYIHTTISSKTADKMGVNIVFCPEVVVGARFRCGTVTGTVKAAVAAQSVSEEEAGTMTLTLSAAVPDNETKIHIMSSVDSLALVGMDEEDITAIKGVLRQYE